MISIYLRKKQPLNADPKAIQQITFCKSLDKCEIIFNFEETKEIIL